MSLISPSFDSLRVRVAALSREGAAPFVTRFAPSPTGYLHLGHAASALFVWGIGRRLGAKIVLRIEDHDRGRCRAAFDAAIVSDLAWLGFEPDEVTPRQSERYDDYINALDHLRRHEHVYGCRCSRKEILNVTTVAGEELMYPGTCRLAALPVTVGNGVRLQVPAGGRTFDDLWLGVQTQEPAAQCGDVLLRDRDGYWTYQFAVAVDDHLQGVNLVVRGQDLTSSTARQIILGEKLGRSSPAIFCHHPLLIEADGEKKLSKRQFSRSLAALRDEGWSAPAVLGAAAYQAGLVTDARARTLANLLEVFHDR